MKNLFFTLICVLLLSACSGSVSTADVAKIEQMIAMKDYDAAQSMCDNIVETDNLKSIQVRDLCKLSICLVKLSDSQNQEDNMAKATKCYKAATEINADSVNSIMAELPIEDTQYVMLLKNLTGLIGAPIEIDAEEPIESECSGDCATCENECDANDGKKADSDKKVKKDQPNKKKETSKTKKKDEK